MFLLCSQEEFLDFHSNSTPRLLNIATKAEAAITCPPRGETYAILPASQLAPGEDAMANREQKGNKEKKKPKADKNKKPKHMPYAGQTAPGQSQDHPGFNVLAKKG